MRKTPIGLLGILAFNLAPAWAQNNTAEATSRENARNVVQEVIGATLKRSIRKDSEGRPYALLMLMTPTAEEQEKVRNLGGIAVEVLGEYVQGEDASRQRVALRLLSLFRSDASLTAVLEFARHSLARDQAVAFLCVYPREKVQPILEKFASSDRDPEVRREATACLDSYKNAK